MIGQLPAREQMLCMYGKAFGGEALLGDAATVCADAVYAIHSEFDGTLWGLREEDVAPCVKQIPLEFVELSSRGEFIEEYHRFRQWLRALLNTLFVREFFIFEEDRLHKCSDGGRRPLAADKLHSDGCGQPSEANNEKRPSLGASRRDFAEATDDNFLPSIGSIVHSKMHGKFKVEAVQRRVSSTQLLRYGMTTPYVKITCSRIHRVVDS